MDMGDANAAAYVQEQLPDYLKQAIENHAKEGLSEEAIFLALKECFENLDRDYKNTHDGTTAVMALVLDNHLWVANVGDSRAVLIKNDGTAIQASEDAKPEGERYKQKIEELGGTVSKKESQWSCCRGSCHWRSNDCGQGWKEMRAPDPKITCYPLESFDYFVLACDGFYDLCTTDQLGEAVSILHQEGQDPEAMSKSLSIQSSMNKTMGRHPCSGLQLHTIM